MEKNQDLEDKVHLSSQGTRVGVEGPSTEALLPGKHILEESDWPQRGQFRSSPLLLFPASQIQGEDWQGYIQPLPVNLFSANPIAGRGQLVGW